MGTRRWSLLLLPCFLLLPSPLRAQTVESAGSRALGMGGAFVAVASDSSATWWNPAGLAAGPFVDLSVAWNSVQAGGDVPPAWRSSLSSLALGLPPAGVSYYRFRLTNVVPAASTATGQGDRQGTRTEGAIRSVPVSQFGVTLVHSVVSGVHVGTTLKYLRGKALAAFASGSADDLLDLGADLEGGDSSGTFDLDVGVMAVAGPIRVGAVGRNLRQGTVGVTGYDARLPRQVRVGAAFDADSARVFPLTIAFDADVQRYDAAGGERRVVALGAEYWLAHRRVGVRGGGRLNTVGAEERAATAGASAAVRSGLYVDAHMVFGGTTDEQGWGVAARVSF